MFYKIAYWQQEESYENAVDYEISKFELGADFVCQDLILQIQGKPEKTYKLYYFMRKGWNASYTVLHCESSSQTLHANGYYVVGTVRANRKNLPTDLGDISLSRGEIVTRSCGTMVAVKWKDKKDVTMLSTFHKGAMVEVEQRRDPVVLKPYCVVAYNKGMGGVDLNDQRMATGSIMRKSHKKIFYYIFDMALANAFLVYNKKFPGKKDRKH